MTVTSYRPIESQTDDSPTITSIGDMTTKFGIAVSQDLLKDKRVKYGDILFIEGYGYRVVNDCMAARHKNAVDLLVLTYAEEKAVGIRHRRVYRIGRPNELQAICKSKGYTKPQAAQRIAKQRFHR